ncbi:DUF4255 domain-containing protein [Mesorhizobium sp. IMUNJ 23232]|uniref:DUF4255 domain-containing protein n=1 Tax=Mesorhizobium sp. IMUNJ 23232 TaxID=3376064 RepID=UPI0037BB8BC8
MSTSDLALVSATLRRLLTINIARLAGAAALPIEVTCGYPEAQAAANRTVNLHLYHIAEDQFRRNLPGPGSDRENVSTTPLALSLFYILTAHHSAAEALAWQTEQQIMGYALKTLHDFPSLNDDTSLLTVQGTPVPAFLEAFRDTGNIVDIILRPLTPEDAINYWAAEQEQPVRLSAHYEVRTILMDPEVSRSSPGIVYSVGQSVIPRSELALTGSTSELNFARPAAIANGLPPTITVSPARPALDTPAVDPLFPGNARFRLLGSGLASGVQRQLMVRSERWRAAGVPFGEIALAPGPLQATRWGVSFEPDGIDVEIGPKLGYRDAAGNPATVDVLPGHYSAAVELVTDYRPSGGAMRAVTQRSNEVMFTVAPRLHRADPPVVIPGLPAQPPPANESRQRITLRISPNIQLDAGTPGKIDQLDIRLIVDGAAYERRDAFDIVPALNDGCFTVAASSVTFQPFFDAALPALHVVRLVVEGVDAQPFWIGV